VNSQEVLVGYHCITQAVNRILKLTSLLQTWPSPWNVCAEYGRYTHPFEIKSNLNVSQEFKTLELCSCGAGAFGLEQWVQLCAVVCVRLVSEESFPVSGLWSLSTSTTEMVFPYAKR